MAKPSLVLAHGMFHGPAHFGPLVEYLTKHGYSCVTLEMPYVHPNNGVYPTNLDQDIEVIRSALLLELDQGHDAILVAHSFSGAAALAAPEGLDTTSRTAAGKSTSVKAIVLMAAFMPSKGESIADIVSRGAAGVAPDLQGEFLPNGAMHVKTNPGPVHFFYQDLPKDEAETVSYTHLTLPTKRIV